LPVSADETVAVAGAATEAATAPAAAPPERAALSEFVVAALAALAMADARYDEEDRRQKNVSQT